MIVSTNCFIATFKRSSALERRRPVMAQWAAFLVAEAETAAKVVSSARQKRP
jgi:hypothetical protein